ncbi:MAG TPA: hypothetical protein DF383_12470 [Deltaproteobacteria bacterium]|nr:hypothetical protein [Deltaproteobacteria bacterium]
MSGFAILFYGLAALALLSGIGVIAFKSPINSALALVVTLFSLAGLYVTLSGAFLATIQILTYAGAIMVLFIFIIMLLNLQPDELEERGYGAAAKLLLAAVSLGLFLVLGFLFARPPFFTTAAAPDFGSIAEVGKELFTSYVIPFELAGILLTVALIGAVLLAKRKI